TWDTSTLPDGTYTLRLTVRDRSGEEAEARVVVSLDNTYPSVVGVVSDAETGEPLAGAVVEAFGPEGFRAVAYTDPQGNYVLRGLKPARYTLRASALGYKEAEQTLQIAMKPDEWRVDFALEKAPPRRPGAISGLVYVSVGREPLGNAEVTVSFGGRVVARATTSSEATTKAGYKFNYRIEGLQPGRYEVSVSRPGFTPFPESQTVEVEEGKETRGVNFSMRPLHYIGRGLQMISVPYDYSRVAPDPATLLSLPPQSLRLAKWEASQNRYVFYPDPPADRFRIGEGYWIYLDNPVSITVEGIAASPAQPYPILLKAGWNQIGNPFTFTVDWYRCQVMVDGETMSVEEATRRGILGGGLWTYEFGSYRLAFTLEPWRGYWVRAFRNCTLLVSNEPISGVAPVRALAMGVKGGWAIKVSIEAGGSKDEENLLGWAEGATPGYDPGLDAFEPPPTGLKSQVRAYFESPSGPLGLDIRGGRRAEWTLAVEIPQGAAEVKVTWEGLRSLPRDVSLVLEDPVAGRRVFLRSAGGYIFKVREGERLRRLKIRARRGGPRLSIPQVVARRMRDGEGVLVRFLITAPAEVEARLLTFLGREVARGRRAIASPGWNG
ncbi:MAG TPA: carboxypeptidase regulatory-like domain-containing protein, partial [Armatimonadetes bacterium]|nr:carboxypeptidase regulatory-like domain-containing protein [Armatimonadota bacterium]